MCWDLFLSTKKNTHKKPIIENFNPKKNTFKRKVM